MACRVGRLPGLAVQCTPVVCLPIPVSRSEVPSILVLPSPFFTETDTIRLLEPEDCDTQGVLRQVLSGAYDKPFVIDDGTTRTLHFSLSLIQSSMSLKDPFALELDYTQAMMSFQLLRSGWAGSIAKA